MKIGLVSYVSLGVGVLLDGEIYVFLPYSGIPLPGPDGPAVDETGQWSFPQIATLK